MIFPIESKKLTITNNLPLYYKILISAIILVVKGKESPKLKP